VTGQRLTGTFRRRANGSATKMRRSPNPTTRTSTTSIHTNRPPETIEHIFHARDEALGAKDLDAAMALYREDAT
jgi:hypothetical protein